MTKKCELTIDHCNCLCPYFYHNYEDNDNIYCNKLNKKIYECDDGDAFFDLNQRGIPGECPLENI